ncbi:MAG: hypothetical protein ACHQLA_04610 [Ignavibacteriales bacterium]
MVAIPIDEYKPTGSYEVNFDSKNLTNGNYFNKLYTGDIFETYKMLILKLFNGKKLFHL